MSSQAVGLPSQSSGCDEGFYRLYMSASPQNLQTMSTCVASSETLWPEVAFYQAAIGLGLFAPNGDILRLNSFYADLLGYAPEELIGRNIMDFSAPGERQNDERQRALLFSG